MVYRRVRLRGVWGPPLPLLGKGGGGGAFIPKHVRGGGGWECLAGCVVRSKAEEALTRLESLAVKAFRGRGGGLGALGCQGSVVQLGLRVEGIV